MYKFYIFIALLLVINSVLKKFLRQKYNIIDPQRIRYMSNTHKWVEIPLIVFAVILFVLLWFFENSALFYLLFAVGSVVYILRAFVEYKYEREEKKYIITLVDFGSWWVSVAILLVYFI
jgi:4-hydroxybenzoate polyprenyltransferase